MNGSAGRYIVTTRPGETNKEFKKKLQALNYRVLEYPTITTVSNAIDPSIKASLANIHEYDWIIFTSQKGASILLESLQKLEIDTTFLGKKHLAAVGPQTAKVIKESGFNVSFIPSRFTTHHLAEEIPNIIGKKILLPRSDIASIFLTRRLKERGADVTNIAIYRTQYQTKEVTFLKKLTKTHQIAYIIFTSPSTVTGFLKNMQDEELLKQMLQIPILSIGPVTTPIAQQMGFQHVITASVHTADGIIAKLKTLH